MTENQAYFKNDTNSLTLSIYSPSCRAQILEKYNLSPETLRYFINPETPDSHTLWEVSTPEPDVDRSKLHASKHKAMAEFFPLTDDKITHDQETQTDEIPEKAIKFEIEQMEGYLIINGVKYIPMSTSPLKQAATQTDQSIEFEPVKDSKTDKIPDLQPKNKMDETSEPKSPATLQADNLLSTKPAASCDAPESSEPKPSISLLSTVSKTEDMPKLKSPAAKVAKPLTTQPLPPTSLISDAQIDPPMRFHMKLSGEDSSDDEFTDI